MIVERRDFGDIEAYHLVNAETGEFVEIITGLGAVINRFAVRTGDGLQSILDGYEGKDDLAVNCLRYFKGAKLFPFANRIRDGRYRFGGNDYQLEINFPGENNAIHGLVLNKKFDVVQVGSDDLRAVLRTWYHYDGDGKGFPFHFDLGVNFTYTHDSKLELETVVRNTGPSPMPLVDGWHPYFTFGKRIDNVSLKLDSDYVLDVDRRMIPTGKSFGYDLFREARGIGPTSFDSCFRVRANGDRTKTTLIDPVSMTEIDIWQETGPRKYNYVQVYTPADRTNIAIEPMTAPPDAFNSGNDLVVLEPAEAVNLKCGVDFLRH